MTTYTDTTGLIYMLNGINATITALGTYNLTGGVLTIPGQVGGSYTVVAIANEAFMLTGGNRRTDITSVVLPNSLLSIGSRAFENCAFNSITWSNSLLSIGNNAFRYCAFTNLVLPDSITTINSNVFSGCYNLTSVILPNSLTTLGFGAFLGCALLNTVTFSSVVSSVTTDEYSGFHKYAFDYTPANILINTTTDVTLWPTYSAGGATGFETSGMYGEPRAFTVVQGTPLAPTASAQTFTSPATVSSLTATRVSVNATLKWYSTSSGGSALASSTALTTGTYYVSQTLSTLESTRASVSVTVQAAEVACFAEGTRVLTQNGYKAIEALKFTDLLLTADQRIIDFKLLKTTLHTTTERTAPYLIQPHAFGHNAPSAPIRLSANHKIQMRKGLWTSHEKAVLSNPLVKQCAIGGPVTYYHIECEDYLKDDIVTEGLVVESLGTVKATGGRSDIYTWSSRKNAYTRLTNMESGKSSKTLL